MSVLTRRSPESPGGRRDGVAGARGQLEAALDLAQVIEVVVEALAVGGAEAQAQALGVVLDGVEEAGATAELDEVAGDVEEQAVELAGAHDRGDRRVGTGVRDRVPVAVVVEAGGADAERQGAEARGGVAVEVGVGGDVLVEGRAQHGHRVRGVVEALGPHAVAGERDVPAAHVAVALAGGGVGDGGVRGEAGGDAEVVGGERGQELAGGVAGAGRGGGPEVGVAAAALGLAVAGVPGHAVGPVEDAEDREGVGVGGAGPTGREHRVEQRHREADGRAAAEGATEEGATGEGLEGAHDQVSSPDTVRKTSLVTRVSSRSRKRLPDSSKPALTASRPVRSEPTSRRPIAWR
jgi:hypothetical protein